METLAILIGSAVAIGLVHTLIGIDHSLPFVVLGRAQGWSLRKTLAVTGLCGFGHVLSSVLLGGIGLALGIAVVRLEGVEAWRGGMAAWLLVAFGLAYAGWSLARRRRRQRDVHVHPGGIVHSHAHADGDSHRHHGGGPAAITAWSLFVIFVLGPCEPLIPLLMVPALDLGPWAAVPVVLAFAATTLGTMLAVVAVGYRGFELPIFRRLELHAHTLAGLAVAASGLVIHLFGA